MAGFIETLFPKLNAQAAATAAGGTGYSQGNPPPGYTWVPAGDPNGHWERARAGVAPNPSPQGTGTIVIHDNRGKTRDELRAFWRSFVKVIEARAAGINQTLLATGAAATKCKGKPCNGDQANVLRYLAHGTLPPPLIPFGTFVCFGAALPITVLTADGDVAGKFSQTVALSGESKFWTDFQIYRRSQQHLANAFFHKDLEGGAEWVNGDDDPLVEGVARLFNAGAIVTAPIDPTNPITNQHTRKHFSVDEILAHKDDRGKPAFVLSYPGYGFESIAPTMAERTRQGGAAAFYARGGFFISVRIADGTDPLDPRYTPFSPRGPKLGAAGQIVKPEYCACADGRSVDRLWGVYFDRVVRVAVGSSYCFTFEPYDLPLWQDAVRLIAGALKFIGDMICSNKEIIAAHNAGLIATSCVDRVTGKTCTKGATNCICTPPTSAEQAAVAVGNLAVTTWCGRWSPPSTPPAFPEQLATDPPKTLGAWPIIAGGALVVGALIANERK